MRRRLHFALLALAGTYFTAAWIIDHIRHGEREHLDYRDATCPCYHRP